jgi:hypothetical protein
LYFFVVGQVYGYGFAAGIAIAGVINYIIGIQVRVGAGLFFFLFFWYGQAAL